MRIAVVGAGGTGGYFGGLLARAGQDVTFIARGAHLEALRARGLTVESKLAGTFTVPLLGHQRAERGSSRRPDPFLRQDLRHQHRSREYSSTDPAGHYAY